MADDILKGNWKEMKGRIQEEWGELTDDEVDQIQGERNQLVGKIQQKYGRARAEVEQEVDDWLDRISSEDYDDDVYDV
ncbi:MAG: CsbD family protein [Candidatus Promineifilaceae bacterium]|nr:CsbD family protein [Candidatus Promineifilaceae bacterium]